jgi:hypothetical protein
MFKPIAVAVIGLAFLVGGCAPVDTDSTTPTSTTSPSASKPAPVPEAKKTPKVDPEVANAVRSAESYLQTMPFSKKGLIEQLTFEGYSKADATTAVSSMKINYNEQAAKAAENYLSTQPFSRNGLIEQLVFEGYSRTQAIYGADKAL